MNSCAHMKPQATVPLPLTRRHNAAFESDLAGFMAEQKARGAERERRLHALLTNKAECHRLSDLLLLENRVRHSTEVFRNEYNYSFLVHNYCVSCSVPKNSRSASIAYSRKRSTASAYKFAFSGVLIHQYSQSLAEFTIFARFLLLPIYCTFDNNLRPDYFERIISSFTKLSSKF